MPITSIEPTPMHWWRSGPCTWQLYARATNDFVLHVNGGVRWSPSVRHVTFSDNVSGRKTWPLRDLIWRGGLSPGYWPALCLEMRLHSRWSGTFRTTQIPTEPRLRFVSADDLLFFSSSFFPFSPFFSSSCSPTWLAHEAGQWVARPVHSHYPDPFINVL